MSYSIINKTSGDKIVLAYRNGVAINVLEGHLHTWGVRVPKGWSSKSAEWKRIGPKTVAAIQDALTSEDGMAFLAIRFSIWYELWQQQSLARYEHDLREADDQYSIGFWQQRIEYERSAERREEVQHSLEKLVTFFLAVKQGDRLVVL